MKIDHIAIVVKNADDAARTYKDMFGFEIASAMEVPGG